MRNDLNVVSGLGLGIGGAVVVGALEETFRERAAEVDQHVTLRPFPQVEPAGGKRDELWEQYRQEMIAKVGLAIFIAGNTHDSASGGVVEAAGVLREFEIAVEREVYPIPIGATGHAAATVAACVLADPTKYYGDAAPKVVPHLTTLNDTSAGETKWLAAVVAIVKLIAPK